MDEDTQRPTGREQTQATPPIEIHDTQRSQSERTAKMRPVNNTVPPPAPAPRGVPPAIQRYQRRSSRQSTADNNLYFPWWSIVLMLLGVLILTGTLIGGAYIAGSANRVLVQPSPVVVIVTANPDAPRFQSAATMLPPSTQVIFGGQSPENLALQGPTLAPIILTPTPAAIRIGSRVQVEGVDLQTLNVRDAADINASTVLFRAEEGEIFTVSDGPRQGNGFTWWQIESPTTSGRIGWAVSNYLSVISDS